MAQFDPTTARPAFDPTTATPFQSTPGGAVTGLNRRASSVTEFASQRDPGIDYHSGVNAKLRTGFSFMSTDAQKESYLNKNVGQGNWTKDSFGAYVIKPEGMKTIGVPTDKPVALDEQRTTLRDFADLAGDVPSIVGGIGGGMMASGAGVLPGLGMSALGAMLGRAGTEIGKNLSGYGGSSGEVATEIGKEGALAATGEGVVRGLKPLGRFAMGPGSGAMTPERKAAMDEAVRMGFKPRPGQITDKPILSRWEGMATKIFGDLNQPQNAKAAQTQIDDLLTTLGPSKGIKETGEGVSRAIVAAREAFGKQASNLYSQVDNLVGGRPIVSTKPVTEALEAMVKDLPVDKSGNKIFPSPELQQFVAKYGKVADQLTVKQAQQLRTAFREAAYSRDLVPGLEKRQARMLFKAVNRSIADLKADPNFANSQGARALEKADQFYREGISKFDNPVIAAITRDASERGSVDPDMVVEYLIKPGRAERVNRVRMVVPPKVWDEVKRTHGEELLSSVVQKTDDPFTSVFSGPALTKELDKYGRDTLNAVYGKQWVDDAYKLAGALKLVSKGKTMSGGIVAANIALHPLQNLPKLVYIRGMVKLMQQPGTLKYLTTGFTAPKTRAGVEALARITAQAQLIADDETGSALFTVTSPEPHR